MEMTTPWTRVETELGPMYERMIGGYYQILTPGLYAHMLELMEKENGKETSSLLQADR